MPLPPELLESVCRQGSLQPHDVKALRAASRQLSRPADALVHTVRVAGAEDACDVAAMARMLGKCGLEGGTLVAASQAPGRCRRLASVLGELKRSCGALPAARAVLELHTSALDPPPAREAESVLEVLDVMGDMCPRLDTLTLRWSSCPPSPPLAMQPGSILVERFAGLKRLDLDHGMSVDPTELAGLSSLRDLTTPLTLPEHAVSLAGLVGLSRLSVLSWPEAQPIAPLLQGLTRLQELGLLFPEACKNTEAWWGDIVAHTNHLDVRFAEVGWTAFFDVAGAEPLEPATREDAVVRFASPGEVAVAKRLKVMFSLDDDGTMVKLDMMDSRVSAACELLMRLPRAPEEIAMAAEVVLSCNLAGLTLEGARKVRVGTNLELIRLLESSPWMLPDLELLELLELRELRELRELHPECVPPAGLPLSMALLSLMRKRGALRVRMHAHGGLSPEDGRALQADSNGRLELVDSLDPMWN